MGRPGPTSRTELQRANDPAMPLSRRALAAITGAVFVSSYLPLPAVLAFVLRVGAPAAAAGLILHATTGSGRVHVVSLRLCATGIFGIALAAMLYEPAAAKGAGYSIALPLLVASFVPLMLGTSRMLHDRHGSHCLADVLDISVFGVTLGIVGWLLGGRSALGVDHLGTYLFVVAVGMAIMVAVRIAVVLMADADLPESTLFMLGGYTLVATANSASIFVPDRPEITGLLLGAIPAGGLLMAMAAGPASLHHFKPPIPRPYTPHRRWRLYALGGALLIQPCTAFMGAGASPQERWTMAGAAVVVNLLVTLRAAMAFRQTDLELCGRIHAEAELEQQARYDPLSGLPNRSLFTTHLEDAIGRARLSKQTLAVLYLGLDRFKVVNDSFGQEAGDETLIAVADRLHQAIREHDLAARLSGDEFAVILEDVDGESAARAVAERIREMVRAPIDVGDAMVTIGTSIGVAVFDNHDTAMELLREADAALVEAKQKGRNAVVLFDAAMRSHIAQALAFEHDLVGAAGRGEMRLHYQPQIDMSTGDICGVEALVRWQHPTQGLLGPGAFLEIAEETGLIVPIGAWVIEEACRQHRRWQATLGTARTPRIAVNVSPSQLSRDDVPGLLHRALAAARLEPGHVHVEITEVALMGDPERAIAALHAIEAQGISIAVDDFGTGYFSLSHLRRFPVDLIKIDQSFVKGVGTSTEDEAIIDATIDLAHALGLTVVAEGIETKEQLSYLHRRGCDVAQGYLFAKPMTPDDLVRFVGRWAKDGGVDAVEIDHARAAAMAPILGTQARSGAFARPHLETAAARGDFPEWGRPFGERGGSSR